MYLVGNNFRLKPNPLLLSVYAYIHTHTHVQTYMYPHTDIDMYLCVHIYIFTVRSLGAKTIRQEFSAQVEKKMSLIFSASLSNCAALQHARLSLEGEVYINLTCKHGKARIIVRQKTKAKHKTCANRNLIKAPTRPSR